MTKKTIKASDVLGDNYYIYELISSNYTPALNDTITITCTMKDVYGTAASGKSITLYQNGTSKGTQTTNNNGVATWSVTCSTAGPQKFNIKDRNIEVFVDISDSVLYETEEVTLGTPTTSSNVSYTYNYNDTDLTLTIPTLNTCQFDLSEDFSDNAEKIGGFELIFEIVLPQTGDAMFKLGDDGGGVALFQTYDSYRWRRYYGHCNYRNEIKDVDMIYYYDYDYDLGSVVNKENITISIQRKGNTATIYFNDDNNSNIPFSIRYNNSIQFSSNVSVNVYAKAPNFPIRLSKFFDDTKGIEELEDGADLNDLSLDKTYIGMVNEWISISNCPVQNKSFVLINRNITPNDSGDYPNIQQILMTTSDGANTELWIRYHHQSFGYNGTWVKLATGNGSVDSTWVNNSTNPVESQLIKSALDSKSDTSHTHSNYVNPTIADNLTTNDSSQVLSAKQGKILNDQIGNILTFFNGGQ